MYTGKIVFTNNYCRGYSNMETAIDVGSSLYNMKNRKTDSFPGKLEDKVSNSDYNTLLGSVLIVCESVDMKDNVVVIT